MFQSQDIVLRLQYRIAPENAIFCIPGYLMFLKLCFSCHRVSTPSRAPDFSSHKFLLQASTQHYPFSSIPQEPTSLPGAFCPYTAFNSASNMSPLMPNLSSSKFFALVEDLVPREAGLFKDASNDPLKHMDQKMNQTGRQDLLFTNAGSCYSYAYCMLSLSICLHSQVLLP